jgi:hypothetical protein
VTAVDVATGELALEPWPDVARHPCAAHIAVWRAAADDAYAAGTAGASGDQLPYEECVYAERYDEQGVLRCGVAELQAPAVMPAAVASTVVTGTIAGGSRTAV